MTDGEMMFYYAQYTRPITDYKRVCERSSGAAAPHPVGCAVNELRTAGSRLAQAHTKCAINSLSASMVVTANFANTSNMSKRSRDNKLKRSVINYRVAYEFEVASTQDSTLPQVMPLDCGAVTRGGFVKGGYPFMFISPFDLKPKTSNNRGEAVPLWQATPQINNI